MVDEFHRLFGIATRWKPGWPEGTHGQHRARLKDYASDLREIAQRAHADARTMTGDTTVLLRAQLMCEELGELLEAMSRNDIADVLHEAADLRYVTDGTVLAFGLGDVFEKAVKEIHRANLSKLEDGRPVKDAAGRVVKGRNFKKANVRKVLP